MALVRESAVARDFLPSSSSILRLTPVGQEAPTEEVVLEGSVSLKLSPVNPTISGMTCLRYYTPTFFIVEDESTAHRTCLANSRG